MRIIKRGEYSERRRLQVFDCKRCGCVFEVNNHEYEAASQVESVFDGIIAKCRCPQCGTMVYLQRGDM
nr:MAG TPA: Transcription initiation factor IIE, alpha FINGER, Transcription [Caudoviricetes sp.]